MTDRDPRIDPQPGDSLEYPSAGCFRNVRIVEMDRVYFIDVDAAGSTRGGSIPLVDWRAALASARTAGDNPSMSAIISECGQYRYRLNRDVQPSGIVVAYFGVNPSTAAAEIEDQTTRKWRGFTLRNGGRRYIAGNPFALRSTDVKALALAADPIGPDNARHLRQIIHEADVLVPCWGSRGKLPRSLHRSLDELGNLLAGTGKPLKVFGLTGGGDPLHPLTLAYDTPLVDWNIR